VDSSAKNTKNIYPNEGDDENGHPSAQFAHCPYCLRGEGGFDNGAEWGVGYTELLWYMNCSSALWERSR
jgi:hypothetical protein